MASSEAEDVEALVLLLAGVRAGGEGGLDRGPDTGLLAPYTHEMIWNNFISNQVKAYSFNQYTILGTEYRKLCTLLGGGPRKAQVQYIQNRCFGK
jgi:hypothetical protein